MKRTILICVMALFYTLTLSAQSSETVYIRVQEPLKSTSSGYDAVMLIIKPDNMIETVPLKRTDPGGSILGENGVIIKKEITKWLNKGFKIISFNSSGGDSMNKTEVFLSKE